MLIWMSWHSRGCTSQFTHLLLLETAAAAREASAKHNRFWMSEPWLKAELQMIPRQLRTRHSPLQRPSSRTTWSLIQRIRRTTYPLLPSLEVLMMMRQDLLVQPESLLLQLPLLRSLSLIHSLLFFRSSLICRIDLLQLSKACKPSRLASGWPRHLCSRGYASSRVHEDTASAAVPDSAADVHILLGMLRTALPSHWTA